MPAALTTVMDLVGDSGERSGAGEAVAIDDGETFNFWAHLSTPKIPFRVCLPSGRSGLGDSVRWLFQSLLLDRLDEAE